MLDFKEKYRKGGVFKAVGWLQIRFYLFNWSYRAFLHSHLLGLRHDRMRINKPH